MGGFGMVLFNCSAVMAGQTSGGTFLVTFEIAVLGFLGSTLHLNVFVVVLCMRILSVVPALGKSKA
jgi:hypothetical protein